MHYYQFNIADYRKDTGHLTLLEHGIYRSLIDTYYLNEGNLPSNDTKLMRMHNVRTDEEKTAFQNVIQDFFYLTESGYKHDGCDKVIEKMCEKSDKARASVQARWDRERQRKEYERNTNVIRTNAERNTNGIRIDTTQYPIPNTHNPIPINKEKKPKRKATVFKKPSLKETADYAKAENLTIDGFYDYYESNGWKVGKNSMKDWKAAARGWHKRDFNSATNKQPVKEFREFGS